MVRFLAVVLLMVAHAASAAEITRVDPPEGFTFTNTTVTIHGTDLLPDGVRCAFDPCRLTQPPCDVTVLFGEEESYVLLATPTRIRVLAPPRPPRTVPVTVRVPGRPDLVSPVPFTWSDRAVAASFDYAGYLLPLTTTARAGQQGSRWETTWQVQNGSDHLLRIVPAGEVAPHTTRAMEVQRRDGLDGVFVWLPRSLNLDVGMNLRVRDVSRTANDRGTEVPIIPIGTFAKTVRLVDIPTDARFRATLRAYAPAPVVARMRVYGDAAAPLAEREIVLSREAIAIETTLQPIPAAAMLDPLTPAVRAGGAKVRVELTADVPLWAMASITNNETQQVTLVTPQPRRRGPFGGLFSDDIYTTAIESITPARGSVFSETYVTVRSEDLTAPFTYCDSECEDCPVTVLFGGEPGRVVYVYPGFVEVMAPPQPHGTVVDVTLAVGGNLHTLPDAFTYDRDAFERVPTTDLLLPLVPRTLDGAHGSRWETRLTLHNASAHRTLVRIGSHERVLEANSVTEIDSVPFPTIEGAHISVPTALVDDIAMQLRVRDVSRSDRNWGVEIPIGGDFKWEVRLVDVPTDERYRAALRVYGYHAVGSAPVTVETPDGTVLDEFDVPMDNVGGEAAPSYGLVDPITPKVRASGHASVNVVVHGPIIFDPPPSSIWAFISLTNNETQHVTTITPRPGGIF